ncbi:hypothetical protein QR680_009292 [Steinernema hermaphroditum]|uniref:S phase cyclin A-associated protein in the endoplasmic reticulum N-terminal domain-containing protein n=1 Tax=Steinernema hermaphroditum TaxID=289476 RepID=A0AA39ILU4_9BILA|nr:hypothetical protein QR680_009292 [Steinernema hermaphroditum]
MKRKSRRRAQKQARQWTYYIEALKRSLDSLYEICRNERNVPACREVMLYLNKGSRDFESLIDSFAVENDYENGLKLPSVTWEIRQTGGLIEKKETETESSCSLISSDSLIDIMPYSPALISDTIKEVAKTLEHVERNDETGWYLVQNRRRRYSSDSMGSYTTQVGDSPESEVKALNVYERLAANSGTRGGKKRIVNSSSVSNIASEQRNSRKVYGTGRLLYPKSAMDLPQTRSSMAKIAYSRRILWEQHRSMLAEKMRKRHRQEQTKALLQRPSSSHSSHDGRNRVTRHSSPLRAKSAISLELESIHEANEDEPVARSEPPRDLLLSFSLDDDEEWRALTVEEESLAQEELSLKKEIEHEESTSIDAELRRQVEAEAAVLEALEKENSEPMHKRSIQNTRVNWKEALEKCTAKLQRQGIHIWNDAISKKITHFRPPGAVVQIHEKLMSPSRQRSGNNNASNMEERLQRAEILRQQLLDAKSLRVKELSKKVEHVKTKQAELLDMKRLLFQAKMETVEQNRQKTLEEIVRKAHDDDQRVLEANFLKNIEENSARMLMELKEGEAEARRQQLEEERARRTEQNAANRVAAEKRREQQNEERNRKLQLCAERRRERQLQIDAQRLEAERLRQEQSREKLEKHQKRLAAIKASQISDSQKLLSEITRKQEECAKRHEESLEVVKKRAIESAQGHCSNRSSTISTHSDELSEPSASESFKILFEAPPAMDIRDRSFLLCGSCGFRAVSDLEAVSHVVFRHVCLSSSSQESSNSLFEVCTNVKCTGPMYVRSDVKAVSCSVKKRRPKLKHKFLEMCNALSNNQPTNVGNVSSQHKLIRNLSIKSMNSFAKYMKIVDERCDSSNTEAWRLFSETDHQLLLKIAREIGIVVSKAEKENATTEIALVLLNKGAIAKLVKLLLFFNFSSKIPCCERALEVLQLLFFHSSFVSYNILHSSLYVNWMDSVATVTKELLELGTESSETDRFLKLRDSISNMLLFNSYLHSGSACHISSPVKAEELSSTCIRYLSSFGFYSNLANYCSKALYCSMDSKLFAFLLNLDSLVFFKGFSGGKDKPSTVLDSDAVKPHILTLFRMLVTVVYRWLPSFCDSTSVDSSDHTAFRKMLEIFISFFKCYGSDTLANYMKTEQPDTAVQLLHILKFFIRSSSAESDFSMENSLADFKLGMKSLSLFCSFGSTFQALCALGHENSILYILATLDLSYYSNFALQGIVAPAIIALLYRNEFNLNLFEKEVNVAFLSKFLKRIKDEKDAVRNLLSSLGETDFDVVLAYFQNSSIKSCPIQSTPTCCLSNVTPCT